MKTAIMIGILFLFCTVSFAANIEVMVADKQSQGILNARCYLNIYPKFQIFQCLI